MLKWEIQHFARSHDRSQFDCGIAELNEWLQKRVSQYERRDLSRTYVAIPGGENRVLGYYAISMHRVTYEALPEDQARELPRIDVPVVLLGRLAVDKTVQRQGLGETVLLDALARSLLISSQVGIRAVEVDAFDEAAKTFYLKYGFVELLDDHRHLFLPMQVIRRLDLPAPRVE